MSIFSDKCKESIIEGMGLESEDFQTEVTIGVYDSGFNDNPNASNTRSIDMQINKPIWGVVTANIDIEFQGGYHTSFDAHYNKVKNDNIDIKNISPIITALVPITPTFLPATLSMFCKI